MRKNEKLSKEEVQNNEPLLKILKQFFNEVILLFIKRHPFISLAFVCLVFNTAITISQNFFKNNAFIIFIIEIFIIFAIAVYLKAKNILDQEKKVLLIAITSFLLHVMYVSFTSILIRQHDVGTIGWFGGHIGYIEYFVKNNFILPNFDPTTVWQFYHPPLHHLISAAWVKINTTIGVEYSQAIENIQTLTLFYSGCITIISYKILRTLNLKKLALIIPFAIICFHPTLTLLSASINNDILCITLMLAAILMTIRWYKEPRFPTIILAAVFLGLSMLTKTSGFIIAPAILVIFIVKIVREYKTWLKLILQYFVFGIVSIPLGMFWSVYNNIRFGMAINHIPRIASNVEQYLGDYSPLERFLDFNPMQFQNVFEAWGDPYREHNIIITILKTSMFGEFDFSKELPCIVPVASLLFYINMIVVLVSVIFTFYIFFKKSNHIDMGMKIFLVSLQTGILAFYIKFCLDFTHIASANFRYIAPTFIIGAAIMGVAIGIIQDSKTTKAKVVLNSVIAMTIIFCFFSMFIYFRLGIPNSPCCG